MATYVRAGLPAVATALVTLTGEPHPLGLGVVTDGTSDGIELASAAWVTLGNQCPPQEGALYNLTVIIPSTASTYAHSGTQLRFA